MTDPPRDEDREETAADAPPDDADGVAETRPSDDGDDAPVTLTGGRPHGSRPPPTRPGAGQGPPSVLQILETQTGVAPKVLLHDEGSAHDPSPVLQSSKEESQVLPTGRGGYQVLGEIARGGMGMILKGHDGDLGRDVAMKVLLEKHAGNAAILQRFVEEAQIGGQLQHPGIVPVYELGLMADERPYFTMKLVKGRTLAALFEERSGPGEGRHRFLAIFEQVCQTIAYAHARKVIHRDLKPANIMVGAFGEVQVVDWGLAKVLGEGGLRDEERQRAEETRAPVSIIETVRSGSTTGASESLVGSVMGTPAYMSPEQARGDVDRLDERTDVFALGSILCEILTGRPVYTGDGLLDQATHGDLEPAHERLSSCGADAGLVELVKRCVQPSRRARPRNGDALVREVQAYLSGREERMRSAEIEAAEARVRAENERKARRLTLALAAAVLVIAVGGGGGWLFVRTQAAEAREITAQKVESMLTDARRLRDTGDYAAALSAAERGQSFLVGREASPQLEQRVAAVVAELTSAATAARAEADERSRLEQLLEHLDTVQFSGLATADRGQLERDVAFEAVFKGYGLDVLDRPLDELAAAIVATGHAETIGRALDEWARVKRKVRGWQSAEYRHLNELAKMVDPDPLRVRMREAIEAEDRPTLELLASSEAAARWPPETTLMFVLASGDMGFAMDLEDLLRSCHRRHPDNASISLQLANHILDRDPENGPEAIRFLTAAVAAKPDFAMAKYALAGELGLAKRTKEAAAVALDLIAAHRDLTWVTDVPGRYLNPLINSKDRESALAVLEALVAVDPDNHDVKRFLCVRLVNAPRTHRDPQRAYALAREALEHESEMLPEEAAYYWVTLAVVAYWDGRYADALHAVERYDDLLLPDDDSGSWLLRSIVLDRIGRTAEGRPWYERGRERALTNGRTDPVYVEFLAEARRIYGD